MDQYLYVYVSNETPNIDVFFDNLQVTHIRGPLIEETHYYPFGLQMTGISSKALSFGNPQNRHKFNGGNELQSTEFSDGSGLELYDATNRMYDPPIGRFFQIDEFGEVSEEWSPYAFSSNNPISRNDPLGLQDTIILKNVTVFGFKGHWAKINFYYALLDHGISIDKLANDRLREQMYQAEVEVNWRNRLADLTRKDDETFLELASWFIPESGILKLAKLRKLVALFKLKRGIKDVKIFKAVGAAMKGFDKVLQTGGNTLQKSTLKALGLTKEEGKIAIEALKKDLRLSSDFHSKIMGNGDLRNDAGEVLGNLFDYLPNK